MRITINDRIVETLEGETLLETCRRVGIKVPSLCYAPNAVHKPSCMVCMVQDLSRSQMIPSCSTYPVEGMRIDTESPQVVSLRKMALDLLLRDHRADCEAPCVTVCPHGLNIEGMLASYDKEDYLRARKYLAAVFDLPSVACEGCKAPCEKVCRRNSVDAHVEIRSIVKELAAREDLPVQGDPADVQVQDKTRFSSRQGVFTEQEKIRLRAERPLASNCLHCACAARSDCRLRDLATEAGIKTPRFGVSSAQPFKKRKHITGDLWFEPAKCIHCGLCVYNTVDGFSFKGRGFTMQVDIPEASYENVSESLAELCPTGALSLMR